jgi:G3E family GTPase
MNPLTRVVPVTLITGFLGAGKTTLLNHVLRSNSGKKFAVIENEFGTVGVDGSLVDVPRDVLFEINDGCVCCTVQSDLLEVFEELINRAGEFDHVIIETTGLADPVPVMRLFERPAIHTRFELQGIVTVVDALHINASLQEVKACQEQITYADLLILNKTDCVSIEGLQKTESALRTLNPFAQIIRARQARVDVNTVLQPERSSLDGVLPTHDTHKEHEHQHDQGIVAVAVETYGQIDIERLDQWLYGLTRRRDLSVLRMKGLLAVPGQSKRFVFHGVRDVIDVRPDRPWGGETRKNRIVFIGRALDKVALQNAFTECLQTEIACALG